MSISRPAGASSSRLSEASPLLLASGSPRRREILHQLRVPHLVAAPSGVDESVAPGEHAGAYLERVVQAKLVAACAVFGPSAAAMGDTLRGVNIAAAASAVLVADTSVILDGAILGKPASLADAEAMIGRLAGRTHEVWTRFAIGAPTNEARVLHAETVITRVTFRALTPERIRRYAESGEGDDKAGSYAVQGLGAALVARIEGSYSNVVGLPATEVVVALENLGFLP
jgi:septum formation protein